MLASRIGRKSDLPNLRSTSQILPPPDEIGEGVERPRRHNRHLSTDRRFAIVNRRRSGFLIEEYSTARDVEVQCSEGEREAMPYLDAALMLKSTLCNVRLWICPTPAMQSAGESSVHLSKASSVRWSAEGGAAPFRGALCMPDRKCAAAHARRFS